MPATTHYTPREVAKLFGVSVRTIYRLTASGALGYTRVGNGLRISNTDIDEFKARKRGPE